MQTGAADSATGICVNVTNATPNVGEIRAALYDSAGSYMKKPASTAATAVGDQGTALLCFGSFGPGKYAVTAYYDENGNGELDTRLFGIPKEKIAFSNNARGRFGPAKWADVSFDHLDKESLISIQLVGITGPEKE